MPPLTPTSTLPLLPSTSRSPHTIPRLGFGVYLSPANVCTQSCQTALKLNYRHIDTAQFYGNEAQVGDSVRQSGLSRKDVFITTKILSAAGSVQKSYEKCVESVAKISGGKEGEGEEGVYVDLFLIHSPNAGSKARKEMWLALEKLYDEGKAKAIGVSNFGVGHIEEMKAYAAHWPPCVNQIELHPWCQQREIVRYCERTGVVVEAYSPLVRGYKNGDEVLKAIARKVGRTEGQVLVRWSLQRGWVPLPKSDKEARIEENAGVFGWELGEEEMERLNALDEGEAGSIVQWVENS